MNIKGFEVSEEQEKACVAAMGKVFKTDDVIAAAVHAGVPHEMIKQQGHGEYSLAALVANRILQRECSVGKIVFDVNVWIQVSK